MVNLLVFSSVGSTFLLPSVAACTSFGVTLHMRCLVKRRTGRLSEVGWNRGL